MRPQGANPSSRFSITETADRGCLLQSANIRRGWEVRHGSRAGQKLTLASKTRRDVPFAPRRQFWTIGWSETMGKSESIICARAGTDRRAPPAGDSPTSVPGLLHDQDRRDGPRCGSWVAKIWLDQRGRGPKALVRQGMTCSTNFCSHRRSSTARLSTAAHHGGVFLAPSTSPPAQACSPTMTSPSRLTGRSRRGCD